MPLRLPLVVLDVRLTLFHSSARFPIGELSIMEVLYDYAPAPADRNLLPLKVPNETLSFHSHAFLQTNLKARLTVVSL